MHLDGHPQAMREGWGWLCAPGNHNSCHWGSALSLWEVEDETFPSISCSLGNPAASDKKQPWSYFYLTLDELALLRPGITWVPQIPLRSSRNEKYSKQAFYLIETGGTEGLHFTNSYIKNLNEATTMFKTNLWWFFVPDSLRGGRERGASGRSFQCCLVACHLPTTNFNLNFLR